MNLVLEPPLRQRIPSNQPARNNIRPPREDDRNRTPCNIQVRRGNRPGGMARKRAEDLRQRCDRNARPGEWRIQSKKAEDPAWAAAEPPRAAAPRPRQSSVRHPVADSDWVAASGSDCAEDSAEDRFPMRVARASWDARPIPACP